MALFVLNINTKLFPRVAGLAPDPERSPLCTMALTRLMAASAGGARPLSLLALTGERPRLELPGRRTIPQRAASQPRSFGVGRKPDAVFSWLRQPPYGRPENPGVVPASTTRGERVGGLFDRATYVLPADAGGVRDAPKVSAEGGGRVLLALAGRAEG